MNIAILSSYSARVRIAALLISLIAVLVYLPALQNGFVNWDDHQYIYENPNIQHIDGAFIKWIFGFHVSNWHPLTWLSHALDYALWGLNPMGHHLTSILLHGINTFLVVLLVFRLVDYAQDSVSSSSALIAATVTGLLFGLHPLHVESVAWVSERKDVLYALFYLLSILVYVRYAVSKRGITYVLCLLFFVLSLLSKPMAVTLPVVLLILDIYPLGRLKMKEAFTAHRGVLIEKLPFIGLSIASSVITIMAQQKAIVPLDSHPLGERVLIVFHALGFYLFKMLWPIGLYPIYPYQLKTSLFNLEYIGTLVVVICITGLIVWLWRKHKVFGAVWAYYVVTLLPVLGIIQVGGQVAADRYTYLPSLGPFLVVGVGIAVLYKRAGAPVKSKLLITALLIPVIGILSILTIEQTKIWKDFFTLWTHVLQKFPDSYIGYNGRGEAYAKSGNYQMAIDDFSRSISLNPHDANQYNNRANMYLKLGNYERALGDYNSAIKANPNSATLHYNRAAVYEKMHNLIQAIKDYDRAIEINSGCANAYANRGVDYEELGNDQEALSNYSKAIELNPSDAMNYYNRGTLYKKMGDLQEATRDFQAAARLGDRDAQNYLKRWGIVW